MIFNSRAMAEIKGFLVIYIHQANTGPNMNIFRPNEVRGVGIWRLAVFDFDLWRKDLIAFSVQNMKHLFYIIKYKKSSYCEL